MANSGEDVITRAVDVQPELFAEESVSLEEAYEVEETLKELEKYSRVSAGHLLRCRGAGEADE